ncbi:hypothetical protein [Kitasatospora sp. P5_F3]
MTLLVSAVALLAAPLAGTAVAAPAVPAGTASAVAIQADDARSEGWFEPAGTWDGVFLHRYLRNGHHYVTGSYSSTDYNLAVYYDQSYDGGRTWNSFVDRRYVNPGTGSLPERYDDGGVWYRACSAAEWAGNPYGNPQWGYNIACTTWF